MNSTADAQLLISKLDSAQNIGTSIQWLTETHSTNDLMRQQAIEGSPEGTVILADSQTGGKGRQGRNWLSSPGLGLYFSFFLKPRLTPENLHQITLVAGVGLLSALKPFLPKTVSLKWPNDILVGEKKLAGILSETVTVKNETGIIVGIGINVNHTIQDFPPPLNETATSLLIEKGQECHRVELAAELLRALDRSYATFLESGLAPVISSWEQNARMLGKKITVTKGSDVIHGTALRLAPSGGLVILTRGDKEIVLDSGEVHLTPPNSDYPPPL